MNSRNQEEWKDVKGYEGLYEVSSLGRVRSLPRATTRGVTLKQHQNRRNGYMYCCLCKNNKKKTVRVHKVVLEAFTDYISGASEMVIDHIDGDKTNNRLDNLETVTMSENMVRAYAKGLEVPYGIDVIDLDTKEKFISCQEASRSVGGKRGEMVARVCRGERSHYRNHRFAYYDDYLNNSIPEYKGRWHKKGSESLWQ